MSSPFSLFILSQYYKDVFLECFINRWHPDENCKNFIRSYIDIYKNNNKGFDYNLDLYTKQEYEKLKNNLKTKTKEELDNIKKTKPLYIRETITQLQREKEL